MLILTGYYLSGSADKWSDPLTEPIINIFFPFSLVLLRNWLAIPVLGYHDLPLKNDQTR